MHFIAISFTCTCLRYILICNLIDVWFFSLCHVGSSLNMFHKPSFACTTFSVGELNQTRVPTTQIQTTLAKIHDWVLVDVAPRLLGRPPPPSYATPTQITNAL
jgi:hypothetical protein